VRVALHDWTFLFGPGLAIGINTTLLASLIYRSQLVPRTIAVLGLIGRPLVFSSSIAVLLGPLPANIRGRDGPSDPVFAWETSLAGWMIAKGFKTSPILDHASN
jgi:hypothetical protein